MEKPEFTNSFFREKFLEEVKKRSPGSYINNKLVIRDLIKEIPKPFTEFSMIDMQNYFLEVIDNQKLKKTSKNSKRYMLMSFFNFIQKTLLAYKIEFSNPVPSKKIFKFATNLDDISHVSDEELKLLTINQLIKILDYTYNERDNLRDFILFGLDITSGARISEIRTIMTKDVNLKNCSFQTGFIPGARKTTLHTNKSLLFFFPIGFKKYIKRYLWIVQDEKYLFPGYKNNCLSRDSAQKILDKVRKKTKIKFTWHYFRRTIISMRIKKGCPKWLSKGLANHAPSDVQEKSYIKLSIKEKRAYYKKYFPFGKISYFLLIS